jgi:hypothetical protein
MNTSKVSLSLVNKLLAAKGQEPIRPYEVQKAITFTHKLREAMRVELLRVGRVELKMCPKGLRIVRDNKGKLYNFQRPEILKKAQERRRLKLDLKRSNSGTGAM